MPLKFPTWSALKYLGTNIAVRSANIWAIVVPIAAKLLSGIQDIVTVELFGHSYAIHFALPFSWKVFFFAAMAFLIANLIFSVFSPVLIRETNTYRDFSVQRRSGRELGRGLAKYFKLDLIGPDDNAQWSNWVNARSLAVTYSKVDYGTPAEADDRAFAELYDLVRQSADIATPAARVTAGIFYALGLGAFALVLLQNAFYVAGHW